MIRRCWSLANADSILVSSGAEAYMLPSMNLFLHVVALIPRNQTTATQPLVDECCSTKAILP